MEYKLIASDLDETLLNDDHVVPESNIYWIQKAVKERGVKFVPATGRGYMQILPELTQLGLKDMEGEYVLSFNGAALTENKDNRIIEFNGLGFDKMKEIFEFGLKQDVCIHVYTNDTLYIYNLSESEAERLKHQKLDVEIVVVANRTICLRKAIRRISGGDAISITIISSGISAHVQLLVLGMKRDNRIAAVIDQITFGLHAICKPFVVCLYLWGGYRHVIHNISGVPPSPVLQIQTAVGSLGTKAI